MKPQNVTKNEYVSEEMVDGVLMVVPSKRLAWRLDAVACRVGVSTLVPVGLGNGPRRRPNPRGVSGPV